MLKKIYLNPKQLQFVQAQQKIKTFVGGRGSGKSTVDGVEAYINVVTMPRSKGFILGLTYKQILDFILPSMLQIWDTMGLKENVHYVINKTPNPSWPKPYHQVRDYSTCISFCNGSVIQLIGFDRRTTTPRGGSFDWCIVDEAALINRERLEKELLASIRGNIYRFKSHRLHSEIYTTSMPWDPSGFWVPDMSEKALEYPKEFFYLESTARDNEEVLGKDYLERAERKTDYLVFQVEYMNQRIGKMPNSFYDSFDIGKHCYVALSYEDHEDWRQTKVKYTDYNENKELDLSFDFGGNFNCMVVAQDFRRESNELKILRSLYVKNERKLLDNLVNDFCELYKDHKKKLVYIFGDRNGNNRMPNSNLTLYQQIQNKLRLKGWESVLTVKGLDSLHSLKHITINKILAETEPYLPKVRINKLNNKELIISIQAAGITSEFKKDKRSERQDIPQEKATHFSDAFDNYIVPKLGGEAINQGTKAEVFFGR
jgi:hypothetical protein